ncbi:putative monooxygenase [Annulohypoxylon truncatum]|uniref:putative monooxygenase n=1 Tax=Annulohypoxylon truncatum TaxID=327061 RepID=UPI00200814C3|nr:putative monooxygenase [Annulohypoxylon truncatum]KAI1204102.1 putative monooxygenase [Annulohypoxylon truncatum]
MESQKPFHVIIVGCGLVGLTAAHIFSRAGIDFTVLEKHDTVVSLHGTTLALWPQTLRVFDQMGLLSAIQPSLDYVNEVITLSTKDARIRMRDDTVTLVEKNHGHGIRITHRPELVKFLYESLSETVKPFILLEKRVVDIKLLEDGVKVLCAGGSTHEGSIVVGADGVRSNVRVIMRSLVNDKRPENLPQDQRCPYTPTYRLYFGRIPVLPGLAANTRYDGTCDGLSTQIVTGTDRAWFGVYEHIRSPTPTVTRYTEADKLKILDRCGHLYMAPGWKVHEVDANRIGDTGLIDLEEGLIKKWASKRIVLVGDAVRKLEPHAGLGYNSGVTDLVVLVNGLRRLLQHDRTPDMEAMKGLFEAYEHERLRDTKKMAGISSKTARLLAWLSWKDRITAKYLLPNIPLSRISINNTIGPLISKTPVLEWLEEAALPRSLISWKHHPITQRKFDERSHGVR